MSLALLRTFSTAGLSLVVEKQPLVLRHSAEVVQLDIGQAERHERFRLFLGNARSRSSRAPSPTSSCASTALAPEIPDEYRRGIAEIARIRRHGRQHVATEVYVFEPGLRIYARGQVWHPDPKPLSLRGWHRVLLNREPLERIPAVRWCD